MRLIDIIDLDSARAVLDVDGDGEISDEEITAAIAGSIDLAALGALAGPGGAVAGQIAEAADLDEVVVRGLVRAVRLVAGLVRGEIMEWRREAPERRAARRARRAARRARRAG